MPTLGELIPNVDVAILNAPVFAASMLPEEEIEVTAFNVATGVAGDAPSVAGNIKFGAYGKEFGVNGDRPRAGHRPAGSLTDHFEFTVL